MSLAVNYMSVTYILIGINLLVFAAETLAGGSLNRETALKFGAMYPPYIKRGQWYRMFTSMFLHFGFLHLICNMYSLYNLAGTGAFPGTAPVSSALCDLRTVREYAELSGGDPERQL